MNTAILTTHQQRVFDRIIQGETNLQIAKTLSLSEKTIKAHVTAIFKVLNCNSRARLIARHYQDILQAR